MCESREGAKYVFERKLGQQSKSIKLAHAKIKEKQAKIQAIQFHHLITSVAELDPWVTNITLLSIPQNAELRELVKAQQLLHTLMYNQKGINLSMTANGKLRPIK